MSRCVVVHETACMAVEQVTDRTRPLLLAILDPVFDDMAFVHPSRNSFGHCGSSIRLHLPHFFPPSQAHPVIDTTTTPHAVLLQPLLIHPADHAPLPSRKEQRTNNSLPLSSVDATVASQIRPARKRFGTVLPDTFVGSLGGDGALGVRGALVAEVILAIVVQVDIQVQIKVIAIGVAATVMAVVVLRVSVLMLSL